MHIPPLSPPITTSGHTSRRSRYLRSRDLPLLLPMWPAELDDISPAGRSRIVAMLRRALRAERARGLAGHWTYDLARHAQLRTALDAELAVSADRLALSSNQCHASG